MWATYLSRGWIGWLGDDTTTVDVKAKAIELIDVKVVRSSMYFSTLEQESNEQIHVQLLMVAERTLKTAKKRCF